MAQSLYRFFTLFQAAAAVDGSDDLLLFFWLYANGIESLPCAAVWADVRLVVVPRKSRMLMVGLPAPWADKNSDGIILRHNIPPHI